MRIAEQHPWKVTYQEAVSIQERLRRELIRTGDPGTPKLVAGADVAYSKEKCRVYAAVVVLAYPEMEEVETATASGRSEFPYIPGLLTFREGPVMLRAFEKVAHVPEVVMFDGQGYSHPRRMGLAGHMGVLLNVPSIGCAKTRLVGEYEAPGNDVGDWSPLADEGEVIGRVVRTRRGVKPMFISVGHKIGLEAATRLVLACVRGYRLPEPTRRAHLLVREVYRIDQS